MRRPPAPLPQRHGRTARPALPAPGRLRRLATAVWLLGLPSGLALASDEPASPADDVPPEAVLGSIPFYDENPYRVKVNLAPDGNEPFVWILDTGAQGSVMTPLAARAAGIKVRRDKRSPYVRKTRLGHDVQFRVDTRASDTGSRTGWEYALLGGEFLEEFVVEIDFPRRVVRFLDPKRYEVPEQPIRPEDRILKMRVTAKRPFIELPVGDQTVWVAWDTGAPQNLVLSGKVARKLGIDWKTLPDFGSMGTTIGPMDVRLHEIQDFQFAGADFGLTPVLVAPRGWYNAGGSTDSVVGYELMRPFLVRLDYRRGRLLLRQTAPARATYLGLPWDLTRRAGLLLTPVQSNTYRVIGVTPGGAAARLGVRPGDVPVRAAGDGDLDVEAFLARVERGDEITVAREDDGTWVDVILPDPLAPD